MLGNKTSPEPMAIVGMGSRWAGGARDNSSLWEFLLSKRSAYSDWAEPRFSSDGFYHPNPMRPGSFAAKGGYVVQEDPRLFDPSFFGISGLEVETMDPSQRKLLEVVYEAFESAGESWESVNGTRTGVYVADIMYDNAYTQVRDWDYSRAHATTGACHNMLSNRINYIFNLKGPSITLDSACTSAMYGLHMAIQAIRDGDCDSAVVATSNWIMDPNFQIAMDKLGALSATSMSHAFDASADGYARGEGFAAIYLKRPEQAIIDGSPIRALVRGSAIGSNGRSEGITHPSGPAQEEIIRKAYENAGGLAPCDTPFLECHGTGTRVGDPLEVRAAGNVFGVGRSDDDPLLIGSVKTQLGHTEGAAAMAGIFKVVLALENGIIPPSRGVDNLNPRIDFKSSKTKVITEPTTWPVGKPRRAGVTSAGFGGSIGHCILDHVNEVYPDYVKPGVVTKTKQNGSVYTNGYTNGNGISNGMTKENADNAAYGYASTSSHPPRMRKSATACTRPLVILPFSAHSKSSLQANINALSNVIHKHSLADVAYTLGSRRSKLAQRTFRIVEEDRVVDGFQDSLPVVSTLSETPNLGFIFTGQGAQWHAMGAQLFEYHVFRSTIKHLDFVLGLFPKSTPWTIEDILRGVCDVNRINDSEISQTVCTAVQVGLVDLLASWSVHPRGVVGHSSGEMAAAYAAGCINAAEAITFAYFRGQAVSQNKRKGAMLAVGLNLEQGEECLTGLEEKIKIAAINSPASLTLSGDQDAVEELSKTLTSKGVFNRLLKTGGNAYHSHHMRALGVEYDAYLAEGLAYLDRLGLRNEDDRRPRSHWASSVKPSKAMSPESVMRSYWRLNLESPVRFSEAVTNLVQRDDLNIGLLVEIGPHPALKSPVDQILKSIGRSIPYAGCPLKRGQDSRYSLLSLAGSLFNFNAQIDLVAVNATDELTGSDWELEHGVTAVDLPPYQYTYGPVSYFESRVSKEYRLRRVPRHDLIGSKVAGNAKLRPQYRNILRITDLPWLADHRLLPDAVLPAAGYMVMAMVAASQLYQEFPEPHKIEGYSLRNVNIKSAMKIPEDKYGIEVMLSLELEESATVQAPTWTSFSISSTVHDSERWTEHCTGMIKLDVSADPVRARKVYTTTNDRPVSSSSWYRRFASIGLGYGPTFQALSDLRADPSKNMASAKLGLKTTIDNVKGGESFYPIHPSSLDSMIQLGLVATHGGQLDRATMAYVPVHLSQLHLRVGSDQEWATATAHGEFKGLRSAYLQLQLHSRMGEMLLDVKDLRCISYTLENHSSVKASPAAFASPFMRNIYKPDIRALSDSQAQKLFPPPAENVNLVPVLTSLETIASLIVVDAYNSLPSSEESFLAMPEETRYYLSMIQKFSEQRSDLVNKAFQLSTVERKQKLQGLLQETAHLVESQALQRLHQNMVNIISNHTTGEEVLSGGGLLADFFAESLFLTGAHRQVTELFDSLGHANPGLRILELKGGRGQTADIVLEALGTGNNIKRYQDYTFTNISESALEQARGVLSRHQDVTFSVLDLEEDPLQQGFEPVYDVVLASQAVHTTSSVTRTLSNARRLLRPGGKLVLVEATESSMWVGLIGGAQKGYWHGVPDGRTDSPFLNVSEWDRAVRSAGFSGIELTLIDYPSPATHSHVFVTSAVEQEPDVLAGDSQEVWLLHNAQGAPALLNKLEEELKRRSVLVKTAKLDQLAHDVPAGAHIIAFIEGEDLLLDADQQRLDIFRHLLDNTTSLICLTSTGMARGRSPNGAIVGGLLRVFSAESPTGKFRSIDIDAKDFEIATEDESVELVRVIADLEHALQKYDAGGSDGSEDREFAWHSGCLWVSRLTPEGTLKGYAERIAAPTTHETQMLPLDTLGPVRADFETPGILSSLYFRPYTEFLQQPALQADWMEVKVSAVGLNWKDVALCTGKFDLNNLSSEYAGVVTRVGNEAASRFAEGDLVYGMGRGHFSNFMRVPAALAQKADPQDKAVDIATLPLVMMTAVYALENLAHLRPGQKVLIQSASGGLGLAAIQLALSKGAEVFAMASSDDKIRFLVDEIGLPSSNAFAARNPAALAQAVASLSPHDNDGFFDVILSTASGDMLYETVKALAPLGHLIDVGRLDVMNASAICLDVFNKGASFHSFDLYRVVDRDAELGRQLMQTVGDYYRAGRLRPIKPVSESDISQLDQTLLQFSRGTHFGKHVVAFSPSSMLRTVVTPSSVSFDPQASYIVTGGLSGLGRSIVQWMGDRGAREIVILSRRGPSDPEAQSLIDVMSNRGVRIHPVACDLNDQAQVVQAVRDASVRPIKGLVHCAALYRDVSFSKLSIDDWRDGLAAKVAGTRNLHEATKNLALDFFVMTTSAPGWLGIATQSAYTAANNFQDQFARYRRSLGLPATAAQFGLINDIGHLSSNNIAVEQMTRNKFQTISESYFFRLLEAAFVGGEITPTATSDPLAMATYVTSMDPAYLSAKEQEDVELGIAGGVTPRWYGDARVSLVMQALGDASRYIQSGGNNSGPAAKGDERSAVAQLRRKFDDAVHQTKAAPNETERAQRRANTIDLVTGALKSTIAGMLVIDEDSVVTERSVSGHGLDSLIATEFRNWLYLALGCKIGMVDLLDSSTSVGALAMKVVDAV